MTVISTARCCTAAVRRWCGGISAGSWRKRNGEARFGASALRDRIETFRNAFLCTYEIRSKMPFRSYEELPIIAVRVIFVRIWEREFREDLTVIIIISFA